MSLVGQQLAALHWKQDRSYRDGRRRVVCRHVEYQNKHIWKRTVRQVGYLQELHLSCRSYKHSPKHFVPAQIILNVSFTRRIEFRSARTG